MYTGVEMNKKFYNVEIIQTEQDVLCLRIDGEVIQIAWADCSPRLAEASTVEREIIEIAPSGYGLHWPLIDEDLAIRPLLAHAQTIKTSAVALQ